LFVPLLALFAWGEFQFSGEGGDGATPVGDGVAVQVFGGGLGDVVADGDRVMMRCCFGVRVGSGL
jgi:hypothetical protein